MFMTPENRSFALEYLRHLHDRLPDVVAVFVTKARLDESTVRDLDRVGHRCLVFLSQSFLAWYLTGSDSLEPGVSSPEDTARSVRILADTERLTPLHFWRPLAAANLPSDREAVRQVEMMSKAGCVASVAVGVKHGPFLRVRFQESSYTNPFRRTLGHAPGGDAGETSAEESFPAEVRGRALDAGKACGHPVYLNTSCAVALALGTRESLGTFRAPMKALRCHPAVCPAAQRARCDAARVESGQIDPPAAAGDLSSIARWLLVPESAVKFEARDQAIAVAARLDQNLQCRIHHVTGYHVRPTIVSRSREWIGTAPHGATSVASAGGLVEEVDMPFLSLIDRLRRITGLVTPLSPANEHRAEVFSRYYHVRRVVSVSTIVASRWACGAADGAGQESQHPPSRREEIDFGRLYRLAWAHDLNRWPFAHNAEQGLFDQSADVDRYFSENATGLSRSEVADLVRLHRRDPLEMSLEGQIVLAADQATGLVEDVLLCTAALGLTPARIPLPVQDFLAMPLAEQGYRSRLWQVRQDFMASTASTIARFIAAIDASATASASALILRHVAEREGPVLMTPSFRSSLPRLKIDFLQTLLYPLANRKVGRGEFHRDHIMMPLLGLLGNPLKERLTTLTEDQVLQLALDHGVLQKDEVAGAYPELDYIEKHEPELLFDGPP
jgi:hypothetical protein